MARRRRTCRLGMSPRKALLWCFWWLTSYTLTKYLMSPAGHKAVVSVVVSYPWMKNLAAVCVWMGRQILHGLVTLAPIPAIFTLLSILRDVRRWLGPPPALSPSPAELESGDPAPIPPPYETGYKLLVFFVSTAFVVGYFYAWNTTIVSPEKSVFQNAGACLMFLLHGLVTLYVGQLVVRLLLWVSDKCFPTVGRDVELEEGPPPPSEMVVNDGEETEVGNGEKAADVGEGTAVGNVSDADDDEKEVPISEDKKEPTEMEIA
ncbi:hypothetical protein K438DRAFT_1945913 [Mycena galopus ATCC 62051]|nr:hypothetical protein K438DRAFT_1945913 [Mycena galopus ATCC 62051]